MKVLFVLIFLFFQMAIYAQADGPNELDGKFTPPVNSPFDVEVSKNSPQNVGGAASQSLIGFNPTLIPRGIAAVGFERMFRKTFTLGVNLGYCFSFDFVKRVYRSARDNGVELSEQPNGQQILATSFPDTRQKSAFVDLKFKLNMADDDYFNSSYVAFGFRGFKNNLSFGGKDENEMYINPFPFVVSYTNYYLNFGSHNEIGKGNFVSDSYIGIGYQSATMDQLLLTFQNGTQISSVSSVSSTSDRISAKSIFLMFGYNLLFKL